MSQKSVHPKSLSERIVKNIRRGNPQALFVRREDLDSSGRSAARPALPSCAAGIASGSNVCFPRFQRQARVLGQRSRCSFPTWLTESG